MHGCDVFRIRRLRLEDGSVLVVVAGELDLCSSHTFREHLAAAADSGAAQIVVDFTELKLIDSTGLGVLAALARRSALEGGTLTVVCPEGRARTLLAITGLDRVLPVYATRGEGAREAVT